MNAAVCIVVEQMKVTALAVQARNKNRVNVSLDGAFAFGLAKIIAARLRVGQELTEADVERLQAADAEEMAHERALKFLAARPRSEAEVRQRLQKHKVPVPAIEAVLVRLRQSGLLDDQAFTRYWVENRSTFRPRSARALQMELRRKGIAGEDLSAALETANDEDAAQALAAKRAGRLAALPEDEFRRKLTEYLARRGFAFDLIETVVERAWQATRPPDE